MKYTFDKRDTRQIDKLFEANASDILHSSGMQSERAYMQHGQISCYDHSLKVARVSAAIAMYFHLDVDMRSLLRGALLHDYFLYDWHIPGSCQGLHGFTHARTALLNAEHDFELNDIERDIIVKHMFPMNLPLPRYRESVIVTIADKLCATWEVVAGRISPMTGERRHGAA